MYREYMEMNWSRLVVGYMRRQGEQGWIEWTYEQYKKETEVEGLLGVVPEEQEGTDAKVHS